MADTTRLSSKGQIIIPKRLRSVYQWQPGQEFVVLETEEGILLKARRPFPTTALDEVAGSLPYQGPPKSLEEMADAIRKGVAEQTKHHPADKAQGRRRDRR
jgi:AbrB family looped-hinge helix DNA binding protein